jgi:putative FmdB family regulatory protein
MPIYEYECPKCGERFELLGKMSDSDREEKCPRCGVENGCRVLSNFATASGGSCAPGSTA